MKITVCIGSSCHLKGSRHVVEKLKELIEEKGLENQIELTGIFCMGNCKAGVSVTVDEKLFSVSPETTLTFFETEVLTRI